MELLFFFFYFFFLKRSIVKTADGILVPGGFGTRGVEGKILAANYARTSKTPYLGICLGMQVAVIEWARNMCEMKDANSAEFNKEAESQVSLFFFIFWSKK